MIRVNGTTGSRKNDAAVPKREVPAASRSRSPIIARGKGRALAQKSCSTAAGVFRHNLTFLLGCLLVTASQVNAQLIPIRTVPVASGDQFLTAPSATLGMAGTRIAVDDSIADLWSNPAKGVFIEAPAILGAPTFYRVSGDGGSGKTIPFTGLLRDGVWFGGASAALQVVSGGVPGRFRGGPLSRLSDQSARNLYGRAAVGRKLNDAGWSTGLAVSRGNLNAMTGVDQLYAGADRVDQQGAVTDLRAGVFRDGERDRFGLTLIHNRVSMEHAVHYTDRIAWDAVDSGPTLEFREELNLDKTRTLAGHFEWDRVLGADGWRIGSTLTANHKSHPKIPNYDIQNIPRDPGTTWAYEMGFGVGRDRNSTAFGIDVTYQPIWSHTWQEADQRVETPSGVLEIGGKTIENHFTFSNVVLRSGISQQYKRFGFQLGLAARSYAYHLEQDDHVEGTSREQDEAWTEWTPTFATSFRIQDIEMQFSTRITSGTGFPGIGRGRDVVMELSTVGSADFIAAPRGELTLQDATVVTHQVWVRVPIR